jgi:hypothetical protein
MSAQVFCPVSFFITQFSWLKKKLRTPFTGIESMNPWQKKLKKCVASNIHSVIAEMAKRNGALTQ